MQKWIISVAVVVLMCSTARAASITFYTDEAAWTAQVIGIESFQTTASNIALAEEVASSPGVDAQLGPTLTFLNANTLLSRSFKLDTLETNAGFTFDDDEGGGIPLGFEESLSVGDINDYDNDDWQLDILAGPSLYAFGFDLGNNDSNVGELFSIWGANDTLLGSTTIIPTTTEGAKQFLGVISDTPIVRITLDEDATGDDTSISNFQFATIPEPASGMLVAVASLMLLQRRRRR